MLATSTVEYSNYIPVWRFRRTYNHMQNGWDTARILLAKFNKKKWSQKCIAKSSNTLCPVQFQCCLSNWWF
jgi:hypothetical protein